MESLIQDVRFAVRSLQRAKGFTAVVVAVMALAIGANVMAFSMVWALMFRPWPLPHSERVVRVSMTDVARGFNDISWSWQNFREFQARAKSFAVLGAYWDHQAIVTIDRDAERLRAASITSELLPALGVVPVLGRNFTSDENVWGRNWNQVIVSDRIWRERYHADPHALGRTLRLNGRVRQIVGVMPPRFLFPEVADFWIPAGFDAASDRRLDGALNLVGRLADGATVVGAKAEADAFVRGLGRQYPEFKSFGGTATTILEFSSRGPRPLVLLMLFAVIFVLLIACLNVANLMLARGASRRREIGLRLALGATRGRIVRQLLTESVLVSLVAAVIGLLIGYWSQRLWLSNIPLELPFYLRFDIDAPVLLYTLGVTVVSGLLFGLAPALHGWDENLVEPLREGSSQAGTGASGVRLRSGLVVAEVAFSLVLLVGAGLMIRSFQRLTDEGAHMRRENAMVAGVLLPIASYPADDDKRRFFTAMTERLRSEPGVTEVSGMTIVPLGRNSNQNILLTPEIADPKRGLTCNVASVLPGCFKFLGVPLLRGREIDDRDVATAPRVAVINESLARKLSPTGDALGKRFKFAGEADSIGWRTVVGVVKDVHISVENRDESPYAEWESEMQNSAQWVNVLVRSRSGSEAGTAALRRVVRGLNPDLALIDARSLTEEFRFSLWVERLFSSTLGVFALVALVIAAVGLYGVVAYSVAQRTREIGIRMALGADAGRVRGMVVNQAMRLTVIGLGLGLAGAFAVTRFMAAVLTGVSPTDPPTFTVVSIVLLLSGVIAAWVPAMRATRVDPMVALRYE